MNEKRNSDDDLTMAWYSKYRPNGIDIANTFHEIKQFAFKAFELMDENKDGFVTRKELEDFRRRETTGLRERSFISFLLVRMEDIKNAYDEEWQPEVDGISRADIQEYFNHVILKG